MLTSSYSIEELADESGFDKRVIRSFIEQGLLSGPDSKGRYARYTQGHLIRLKAIRLLRDQRQMSLGEIRAAFLSMTEEDINALSSVPLPPPKSEQKSSVLDYLRAARPQVVDEDAILFGEPTMGPSPQRMSPVEKLLQVLQEDEGGKRPSVHGKAQIWQRFSVTPDIEISVRGLQDGGQVEQWERISACLREILLGGSKNE